MQEEFCWVYMTASDKDEARSIGKALLRERLVACVNIIPSMMSMYWWEDDIEEGEEVILVAKTRRSLFEAVQNKTRALHSYDCPCILALPVKNGFPDFFAWIREQTEPRVERRG